ncbi:MAG: hypothetical protein WDZ41_03605 [Candidatus Babeliales bacterium]
MSIIFPNNETAKITYEFSGGRFGDNLLAYLHAKWLSFQYKIPLLYKNFQYSDQLMLHKIENPRSSYRSHVVKKELTLTKENLIIDTKANCVYVVPYFSEFESEHLSPINNKWIHFDVDWKNPDFLTEIQKTIQPINKDLLNFPLPNDHICIAVHIRRGDGPLLSDIENAVHNPYEYVDFKDLLKFPPKSFYIKQIIYCIHLFQDFKLYIYIFTDDENPQILTEYFKKKFENYKNVKFSCREKKVTLLEDFFAMTKFDCLIRPQSNFSYVAAKIAKYMLEISPQKGHWEQINNQWKPIIDEITLLGG